MLIGLIVIYLLIGVFLSFIGKGKFVVPYILFLNMYSAWLTDFVVPLEPGDESLFDGISKYYTYYCFLLFFLLRRKQVTDYSLLYALGGTFLYLITIYTLRGLGPVVGLKFAVSVFGSVLLLFVLLYLRPEKRQIRDLVKWNLIIQLVIGGFQFFGMMHFHMNIGETFVGTSLVTGSFTRNNFFAEVISLLLILQCVFDYKDFGKLNRTSKIFIIFVLAEVFVTGVRTALLADIIVLVLLFYFFSKKHSASRVKYLLGVIVLGLLLFSVYKTANESVFIQDNQAGNPLERQLNGVRELSDKDNMEMSTIVLTFIMWEYFIQSPIIGPGLFYASPMGYGGIIAQDTANSTDATILFYMCETGLIGVICFFIIYRLVLRRYNHYKGAYIAFFYIMIISITDAGFMGFAYMIYLYLVLYYENYNDYLKQLSIRSSSPDVYKKRSLSIPRQ